MRKTNLKTDQKKDRVKIRSITEVMKESYIDYAMSVIASRALPDVRDGLKPVHRRILYTMYEDGLRYDAKFRKSATVVGSCLGRYHPHGDAAVYGSAIRMAQDFSLRYPLIQGQGNVGSIDNPNEYAAMRYTEMRLSKIGQELLRDIEKNTVDFMDNYDGTKKEPVVLPSPLPQLLLNGSLGIAVGMATNIPPHNLGEVVEAIIYLIDNPKAQTQELFQYIQGPDFPTGGEIYDKKGIITAYSQGRGQIIIRGKAEIYEKKGNYRIVITEIPYQVQKSELIIEIANLVSEKKVEGIKNIRDFSDREGMRIVIDLKKGAQPRRILTALYKFTNLQKSFYLNMLALVNGIEPKTLSLPEILQYFIEHRKSVIIRRTKFDLNKAKERAHILKGLSVALKNIDAVIALIKKSTDRENAKINLIKKFKLTEIQANAILEIKLQTLAKLERQKIEQELKVVLAKIKELTAILKSPKKVKELLKRELKELKERYGDKRRTKVFLQKINQVSESDLIPLQPAIVTLTREGYIKRINPVVYKIQKRGGRGITGMKTIGEDIVEHFLSVSTHDNLFFFTNWGKVFQTPIYEIPEGTRVARGRGISNFLDISPEEKILSLIPLKKEEIRERYLVMITKNGKIKKTPLEEFKNVRRNGIIAIKLEKGDLLRKVAKTSGEDEIILVTKKGQSIRFQEKEIRPMGRVASGVKAIRLKKGDEVIGMDIIFKEKAQKQKTKEQKNYLLVVTENGYGKRTDLKEYRIQQKKGSGIKAVKITKKTGDLVFSKIINKEKDLIVISQKGQVIRTKIDSISILSRATQGVKIMKLDPEDKIASATCL